jgi:general secretion pathway protein A
MYETRFGLRERPFRPGPSVERYYPSTTHERALNELLQAIQNDEGLALLTGDPGTGKTVVCLCLLERICKEHVTAFITHCPQPKRMDLLQAVLYDLSLPYQGQTEEELRLALLDFAIKNYQAGKRTVLIFDEAQHLSPELLEELRLLTNLDGSRGKAIQIVLAADVSILQRLERPEMALFNQRLGVRARLEPLGIHESADYLAHSLRAAASSNRSIISDEAIDILARGARGIPRLLNRATDRALELAGAADADQVDVEAAMEALALLGLGEDEESVTESESANGEEADAMGGAEPQTAAAPAWAGKPKNETKTPDLAKELSRARRLFAAPRRPA